MEQTPENRIAPLSPHAPAQSPDPAQSNEPNKPTRPQTTGQPRESIKETIESILVAFILAFVFRAFIVEAFVIPTGSMAPSLLGAHMQFQCEECGYPFKVNFPGTDSGDDNILIPNITPPVFSMHCPNCGQKVQRDEVNPKPIPVYYGDRILVLKYLYLLQDPARWDVVVFKSPAEGNKYNQNFIKRMVGKPGESLMLLDGDVYVCPNEKAQPILKNDRGDLLTEGWPWQVQTKPRTVQDALWRIVYHNDYIPKNAEWRTPQWTFPWDQHNGTGWSKAGGGRLVLFDNLNGTSKLVFNKDANPGTFPLTDWLPYNETKDAESRAYEVDAYADNHVPRWYVSDLKIQFAYRRNQGTGPLRASLTKLQHTFTAELLPDKARLLHRRPDGTEILIGEAPLDTTGELNVEFMNVDYQVTLHINGQNLIQTTPQDYQPDVTQLLTLHRERERLRNGAGYDQIRSVFAPPKVELSAGQQKCQISHLSLWRDIYYTPHYYQFKRFSDLAHASPERPVRLNKRGDSQQPQYADNEYFVLGDNSIHSGDARNWTHSVDLRHGENLYTESGRVPERFMLGKAFFVYWPAGYRPFSPTMPGIIPDFGEMRFIH